jgi:D-aspartate ligase
VRSDIKIDDVSTTVLVLNLENAGLGILRSLGRLGVSVYGVYIGACPPAAHSRYCRRSYPWDFHHSNASETVAFLLELGRKIGRRSLLIPTCDDTALFASEQRELLERWYFYPQNSPQLMRSLCSKKDMYFLATEHQVPTPSAVFPSTSADVAAFAERATFPVMVKGIDGLRLLRCTGKRMEIAHDARELLEIYARLENPAEPNLMLQEYIPGADDTVWMFNGYFDRNSDCLVGFTGKKIRQHPVYTGATSLGILLENPQVQESTRRLMKAVGYTGILDIGYRYDARDCMYKVLDINPRIGGTFRLFLADNGLDVVRAMYLDMTNQPVPASTARYGRKWMTEMADLKSCLNYHRDGKLTLAQWLRSFRGLQEFAFFAWDDLKPFWKNLIDAIWGKYQRFGGGRPVTAANKNEPAPIANRLGSG